MADEAQVTAALRAAILRGDHAPRQRLVEADLCTELGAARFAVRAALRTLAGDGLIELERNKGARIREVPLAEAVEIIEVRMALEGLVAGRAAARVTSEGKAQLRGIVTDMRRAVRAAELVRYSDLNAALHAAIRAIADHPTANRILEQLRAQLVRHQFRLALLPGRPAVSVRQHERIVAAICAGDPAAAEQVMREHIASILAALQSTAEPQLADGPGPEGA